MTKPLEYYLQWVSEGDDRVLVVPGVSLLLKLIYEGKVDEYQIIDIQSLTLYTYEDFRDKTLAFYDYPKCMRYLLHGKIHQIADLENSEATN